ncbi:MAG: hypothetical protein WCW03_00435 [Candidatus Paceibacterota bacterium]|jgi:hypothetical protein
MSIQSYIENLRTKPEHVRRRHAFWYSFGVTFVIFAFWISSWTTLGNTTKGVVTKAVDKVETPAQSLIAGVGSFFVDIKDIVFGPKKIIYSEVEAVPGNR